MRPARKLGPFGPAQGTFLALLPQVAGDRRQVMFTLLRTELPKGFNQAFESAPGLEPQNNNQGSLPDPQVAGASGFYLPAALSAEPWLAKNFLSQGFLETWLHPSGVGPLPTGPTSNVNHPRPSAQRPQPSVCYLFPD